MTALNPTPPPGTNPVLPAGQPPSVNGKTNSNQQVTWLGFTTSTDTRRNVIIVALVVAALAAGVIAACVFYFGCTSLMMFIPCGAVIAIMVILTLAILATSSNVEATSRPQRGIWQKKGGSPPTFADPKDVTYIPPKKTRAWWIWAKKSPPEPIRHFANSQLEAWKSSYPDQDAHIALCGRTLIRNESLQSEQNDAEIIRKGVDLRVDSDARGTSSLRTSEVIRNKFGGHLAIPNITGAYKRTGSKEATGLNYARVPLVVDLPPQHREGLPEGVRLAVQGIDDNDLELKLVVYDDSEVTKFKKQEVMQTRNLAPLAWKFRDVEDLGNLSEDKLKSTVEAGIFEVEGCNILENQYEEEKKPGSPRMAVNPPNGQLKKYDVGFDRKENPADGSVKHSTNHTCLVSVDTSKSFSSFYSVVKEEYTDGAGQKKARAIVTYSIVVHDKEVKTVGGKILAALDGEELTLGGFFGALDDMEEERSTDEMFDNTVQRMGKVLSLEPHPVVKKAPAVPPAPTPIATPPRVDTKADPRGTGKAKTHAPTPVTKSAPRAGSRGRGAGRASPRGVRGGKGVPRGRGIPPIKGPRFAPVTEDSDGEK